MCKHETTAGPTALGSGVSDKRGPWWGLYDVNETAQQRAAFAAVGGMAGAAKLGTTKPSYPFVDVESVTITRVENGFMIDPTLQDGEEGGLFISYSLDGAISQAKSFLLHGVEPRD